VQQGLLSTKDKYGIPQIGCGASTASNIDWKGPYYSPFNVTTIHLNTILILVIHSQLHTSIPYVQIVAVTHIMSIHQ